MAKAQSNLPRLGELELAVLEHLWTTEDADVHETHAAAGKRRGISPNTVGSALERLYKKGLLEREKVSHAYRYRAAIDRETFRARKVVEAAGGLRSLGKSSLLAAFVDLVADSDEAALVELERLIRLKREESGP
jgi:predicted transcriptional regulator